MGESSRLSVYSGLEYCLINFLLIVLSFDNWRIYIDGMKDEINMIKKSLTPREKVIGIVVPFIIFWCGMLTPVFSNSILVWILGIFPFYGFIVFFIIFKENKHPESFGFSFVMNVFTSIFLIVLLFLVPDGFTLIKNICRIGFLNVGPSLLLLFICMTNRFVESIKGCPIPIIPFIIDGGS